MQIEFTIKNYRCFPDSHPLKFILRDGFTSFVGVNNSGKSSILKFFYEFRVLFTYLTQQSNVLGLLRGDEVGFGNPAVRDITEVFSEVTGRNMSIEMSFTNLEKIGAPQLETISLIIPRDSNRLRIEDFRAGGVRYVPFSAFVFSNQTNNMVQLTNPPLIVNLSAFFEMMNAVANMIYIGAFRNAINIGSNDRYFDISVGQSFIKVWQDYKSGLIKKRNALIQQVTSDIAKIFDIELEINPTPETDTFQLNVNQSSFKLDELGAGIAQFIIVLGTTAIRRPTFVLIDEPELNLHPSLQLDFLTTLTSYAQLGLVFSTHSIGLARAASDQIYALRRVQQGVSEICPFERVPNYSEFVGELNFSGYQQLGFDKILLVEGSTEVRTIQQFLRMLKVDHKVLLLHLGGSSMINGARDLELSELTRISKSLFALIDDDRPSGTMSTPKVRLEFRECCKRVGIQCHILERRATENYFTDAAIKAEKGAKYRALAEFEPLEDATPSWAKSENWRIARRMSLDDLRGTDLLQFLQSLEN